MDKKFKIKGNLLLLRDIKFDFPEIYFFLQSFLSDKEDYEVRTSGSTGAPKTISIPKKYMRASAQKTIAALNLKKDDKALLCLPIDRIGGIMMLVRWLEADLDLYPENTMANPLSDSSTSYDFGAMVPYQVRESLKDLGRIKKLIIGGAPIDPSLESALRNLTTEIYHTYGMTETISHVALRWVNSREDVNHFKALPGVSFKVDDRNCLIVSAPEIGVGNLATNDVVELHSNTAFTWKGRYDNVVNSGGVKLLPEELEKKIGDVGFPYFLFGEPDEKLGERLVMIVESTNKLHLEDFREYFSGLSRYEVPKAVYSVTRFLEATGGKINRKATIQLVR